MARRTFSSDDPMKLPNIRPMSNRSKWQLPQPSKPPWRTNSCRSPARRAARMPLGAGSPNARASSVNAAARLLSQSLSTARPPTLEKSSLAAQYSSSPLLRMICCFSAKTSFTSSPLNRPMLGQ
jgi:hypothetical protein